ncbi:alpha/beta fold hydrolase [Mongoliitalea lutea]|uniref:Hydrolase n=1 Tax=Mongoliitalea lutea TaxID=849756 RepID=A0A8J3D0R0_9BACT|nr:alpha/beta fold hydrolase [Mongoliitalea lutea]GHB51707.1 hydrolase [Mongoliitalea lutea]
MKNLFIVILISLYSFSVKGQDIFESIEYPYSVKKVSLSNGQEIAFMDEGEGETLIFVHGLGSYGPAWKKNVEELSKHYRCIAVDLLGYGKSSKPEETYLLKDQARVIQELVQNLGLSEIHLVGHSMGGQIAIHVGLAYPEIVKSLILVAPAGIETFTDQQKAFFEMISPEAIAASSDQEIESNLKRNFYSYTDDARFMIDDRIVIKDDPEFPRYAAMVVNGIRGMVRQPVADLLGSLKIPVLVLFGANDDLIPNKLLNPHLTTEAVAASAKKMIPDVKVNLIPAAGHMLMFEQAIEVNRFIREFVK